MICHPDEVVSFDSIDDAQIDMICHPDEVVNFNSIDDAQIDMICHPGEVVNFDFILGNQNDFFVSLFFLFIQNYDFLTFHFEIRVCLMFRMLLECSIVNDKKFDSKSKIARHEV